MESAASWLLVLATSVSFTEAGFMSDADYVVEVLEPARLGMRRVVLRCDATGAQFGMDVGDFSFTSSAVGCPIDTIPEYACGPVMRPRMNDSGACITNFALVPRGNCSFSEKAYYVQTAEPSPGAYQALIIYNDPNQAPIEMARGKFADEVRIPVVMVTFACMKSIVERFPVSHGYVVQIKMSPGYYDLLRFLVPFIVVVGLCLVILLISLLTRVCRERRRLAKSRLSKKKLKMLPTRKYKKGEQPDTCAICLEEFQEGEKLRILPCRHTYHTKCIDPWLTKNRKVCPLCKRKVGTKEGEADSDSDTERRARIAAAMPSTSTSPGPSYVVPQDGEGLSRERDPLILNPTTISGSRYQTLEEDQSIGSMVVSMSPDVHPRPPLLPNERIVEATVHNVYDSNEHLLPSDTEEDEEVEEEVRVDSPRDLETGISQSLPNPGIVSRIRTLLRGLSSQPPLPHQPQSREEGEDNNAFQESPTQRSPATSSVSVNISPEENPGRIRHPAASGRLTDAELTISDESDVEVHDEEVREPVESTEGAVPIKYSSETHPYGRAFSVPCSTAQLVGAASPETNQDGAEHVYSPEPELPVLDDLEHSSSKN